jgi:ubiquitin C-terminal hydrolase
VPAGLRNLGNTCYVNSVLQCLFANTAFRNTVYAAAPPVSEDPVVKALKELFLEMQQGPATPVDPAPLATALQLDHAVQQDGQEFMKLLLTLLEHRFASQPNLHGVIQNLFRGQSGYETLCMTCNTPSESSSRSDNFYELDVPVRGFKSLDASLTSLLSPEILEGDNQFSCDRCAMKRDATRRLQVRSLPPMLCLSLQRFVYDFVKGDRVKATDKFAFPLELPASALVGGIEQQGKEEENQREGDHAGGGGSSGKDKDVYDLEAILIHKGGSALQGHYVAHIKLDAAPDGSGGTWWRFDDETVTKMEEGPFGTTDHGAGAGGLTGISNKGASGASGSGGALGNKKKGAAGGAGAKGKAGGKAGKGVAKKQPAKKQPAKKKAVRKKKRDEWESDSDDEGDPTTATEGELTELDEIIEQLPPAAAAGTDAEVVDLLADETEEEKKKKRTEIVSSNAYLLVYRRRGLDLSSPDASPAAQNGAAAAAAAENNGLHSSSIGAVLDAETTQWLLDAKSRLAEEFEKQCEAYKTAKADAEIQQTSRRVEVRNLVESAAGYSGINSGDMHTDSVVIELKDEAVKEEEGKKGGTAAAGRRRSARTTEPTKTSKSTMPDGDCGRFISSTWLQQWADAPASSPPPPIDNAPLLCPHGKLDPSRPTVMRRLPTHAWTALASHYRGGPELKPSDACPVCLGEVLDSIAAAEDSSEARDHYLDVAELILSSSLNTIEEEEVIEEDDIIEDVDEDVEIMEVEEEKGGRSSRARGGAGGRRAPKTTAAPVAAKTPAAATLPTLNPASAKFVGGVPAYYVSKPWLQAWHRRGGKSMGTTTPTQSLCCPHGCLVPELLSSSSSAAAGASSSAAATSAKTGGGKGSKRIGISDDFWAFFKRSWQFSETERLRKARAKAAEKLRKNQGGAAVLLDGDNNEKTIKEKKEEADEEDVITLEDDGEMLEIDGVQVFIPADNTTKKQKTTTNNRKQKKEDIDVDVDDDDDIEIVEPEKETSPLAAGNSDINTNIATVSTTVDDITPLAEFPIHSEECSICRAEIEEATRVSKGLQTRVQAEKTSLSHLLSPGFVQLNQGETYYLIPRAFMDHWRAYMTQASASKRSVAAAAVAAVGAGGGLTGGGGGASDFLEAPSLGDYMKRAACDCHSDPVLLAFAPPAVVNRRGRWLVVNNSESNNTTVPATANGGISGGTYSGNGTAIEDPFGFFEVVTLADWSAFIEHYYEEGLVFGIDGISATLHIEDLNTAVQNDEQEKAKQKQEKVVVVGNGAGEKEIENGDGGGEDEKMPDAAAPAEAALPPPSTAPVTRNKRKSEEQEVEIIDEDAQLAKAVAAIEEEDARQAAIENGELDSSSNEDDYDYDNLVKEKALTRQQRGGKVQFKNLNDDALTDDVPKKNGASNKNKKKKNGGGGDNDDDEDDFVPASQMDDEGTVFGQDPDFLYDRRPGGNAHLRPGAAGKAWLVTVPATCTATLEARQVAVKAARLSYMGAEIMVEVCLTDDEAITSTLAAVAAAAAAGKGAGGRGKAGAGGGAGEVLGERKSKRARKGRAPVTIDCTSTLHDLRLRVYQAVGVHPRNARLYCRGQIISENPDEITCAELEIYPNEEIRVVDTQEHDPDDLTGLFLGSPGGGNGKKGRRGGPEGFGGTALTGLHLVESTHQLFSNGVSDDGDIEMH